MNAVNTIESRIRHELGDFADATNVLDPICVGEAQILVESMANIIAVEQEAVLAECVELFLHQIGDGWIFPRRSSP